MVVDKLEKSQLKFTFDVTVDEFEKALDESFKEEVKKVTVKGFRKGHCPRSVFEKMYGVEALFEGALNVVLNNKISEVVKDEELTKTFLGKFTPNLESKIERGKEFKVSLTIDTYPEVTLPKYKGIEVKAKNLKVTAKEVDEAIKALTKKDATKEVKAEQVVAKGDYVTFDFVGSVDGVEFPGGKADNYELQIGSGQFIPGFEDQMVGMKADEVKDLNVTFPEAYQEPTLAGKEAVFKVTVHKIEVEKFPKLTQDYVQSLKIEGVTNSEELKANKRAELEANKETQEKDRQVNDIINKLIDSAKVDMPQTLIDERVNQLRGQYEQQAKMYNIPFDTFLQLMNINKEKFEKDTLEQGTRQALFSVLANKIIEDEKLAPTKEQLEAKAEEEAKLHNSTKEKMLAQYGAKYFNDMAYKALTDLLVANAKEI
ncbi:MAG: trigger factor [Acholeplasmatales bacterium]|nr:trigger factor [Acholeplasmatales bacterium]